MDANAETDMKRAMAQGNVGRATETYLDAKLADVKTQLVIANESMVPRLQGRAQELQDLLKLIRQCREP